MKHKNDQHRFFKKNRSILGWAVILICFLVFVTGWVIYRLKFRGPFSKLQADFGTFGDYFNPFLTLISIILLGYIAVRANEISSTFNKTQLQPILFLSMEESGTIQDNLDWVLHNGYEAPAINILVRIAIDKECQVFTKWIHCFSLGRDQTKRLPWIMHAHEIQMAWTDITQEQFYCIMYRNWTITIDNNFEKRNYEEASGSKELSYKFITNDHVSKDIKECVLNNSRIIHDDNVYKEYLKQKKLMQDLSDEEKVEEA